MLFKFFRESKHVSFAVAEWRHHINWEYSRHVLQASCTPDQKCCGKVGRAAIIFRGFCVHHWFVIVVEHGFQSESHPCRQHRNYQYHSHITFRVYSLSRSQRELRLNVPVTRDITVMSWELVYIKLWNPARGSTFYMHIYICIPLLNMELSCHGTGSVQKTT